MSGRGGVSTYRGRNESRNDSVSSKPRDIRCRIAEVKAASVLVQVAVFNVVAASREPGGRTTCFHSARSPPRAREEACETN